MIVVVGANGFLVRHLCELLEQNGAPAVAVSRNPDHAFFEHFTPSLRVMDVFDFASSAGRDALAESSAVVYLTKLCVVILFRGCSSSRRDFERSCGNWLSRN